MAKVKVWKDINEVIKNEVLPKKSAKYNDIMKKKPNFDKSRSSDKVIYRKREFIIIKAGKGYIVINTKGRSEFLHTHTKDFNYAKSIIDLCIRAKIPKKPSRRIIESLQRVSRDKRYIEELKKLK